MTATALTQTTATTASDHRVVRADCVAELGQFKDSVDLIFADPPYNIGFSYESYDDRRTYDDYVAWTTSWIKVAAAALNERGSLYVMIGDEYAAETRLAMSNAGLSVKSWIIWSYTFGQHRHEKWTRSHVHVFYAVKDARNYIFNDVAIRIPSSRGLVYGDKRTNPLGRVPPDTWTCYSRLCGNFKARQAWHGCQVPEELLARVITASTNKGDLVVDPFAGSGATGAVAKRYDRKFIGFEISDEYVKLANQRLKSVEKWRFPASPIDWNEWTTWELARFYRESGTPLSTFIERDAQLKHFVGVFNGRLNTGYSPDSVRSKLKELQKSGSLAVV
ncbi:MAG: site-specific DNA-methyltransferase [Planctomycetota bacterium]